MGKIYKNQTNLQIERTAEVDITGATCIIKYIKPSGETGSFPATIVTAATGIMKYDVTLSTDIDESGLWKTWAYATFSDGRSAPGEAVNMYVYNEGE
jgi:hypothetical protein